MYKTKLFAGDYVETDMNNFFKKLPEQAKIVAIKNFSIVKGRSSGGYGETETKPRLLVVWEE